MRNMLAKKISLPKKNEKKFFKKPIKIIKKINLTKFKKIASFSLHKTIDSFKASRNR